MSSFTALIQLHVLFISILAICSQRHLLTVSLHLYSYMYYSFLSWPSAAKDTCEQFHCTYTATCIIHFYPGHLQPKTLANSFTALIQLHVLFISILAICSQRHLLTASLHLYSYMYYSFLSWPSAAKDTC